MANFLYAIAKQGFLTEITVGGYQGQMNWRRDTFGAALVKGTYEARQNEHISLADIGSANLIPNGRVNLVTGTNGVRGVGAEWGTAYADTVTFTDLPADGTQANFIVIYLNNGNVDADNVLVSYIDTAENLPILLNGGNVEVRWDTGQDRIFRL
jgi:hypothetical protein